MLKKLCITLLLTLISVSTVAAQTEDNGEIPAKIKPSDCLVPVPDSRKVECGYLLVPADRSDPDSSTLRLPYILMPSRSPNAAPDPIIFTVGGPGYSSLDSIWGFVDSPMSQDRDVIIFEQRGNIHADPALACDVSIWWDEELSHTPCLDAIREKGINLSDYTSANLAADIVDLRQALGYDQWNLYGTSYSTNLMQHVMKMDPEGVRSAVLQSVVLPFESHLDHQADFVQRSLDLLFRDCAADPGCAAAFPDLENQFHSLIRSLNEEPVEVMIYPLGSTEQIPISIDGVLFINHMMVQSFYHPAFLPFKTAFLPLLISEAAGGNHHVLASWEQEYWTKIISDDHWAWGLMVAINCQEQYPGSDPKPAVDAEASRSLDGYQRSMISAELCRAWNLPPAADVMNELITVETPTLILAGAYDPTTPPEWGQRLAAGLPNSHYYEFAASGHEVTMNNPCAQQLQAEFINNPHAPLDETCLQDVPAPSFVLPSDLYIITGLYNSSYEVEIDPGSDKGIPWLETLLLISLLLLFLSFASLIVIGIVYLLRRGKDQGQPEPSALLAYFVSLAIVVIAVAVPLLTTTLNNHYLNGNQLIRTFGADRDYLPATLLGLAAPILLLLVLLLAALVIWAWIKGRWTGPLRLTASVVVLAVLPLLYLGFRWGLYSMLI